MTTKTRRWRYAISAGWGNVLGIIDAVRVRKVTEEQR